MCLLMDDKDEDSGRDNSGSPRLQLKHHHTWLFPPRILKVTLAVSLVFVIFGMILLAIGGGMRSTALHVIGGIIFGIGIIGLIVCLVVCLYAYFFYGTKDQSVQTDIVWMDEYLGESPGYASIGRPSALKSAESTLRRNGMPGQKKVTMAPEVGHGGSFTMTTQPQMKNTSFGGGGGVLLGEGSDPRGAGGRSPGGTDVGTGGIRITSLDRPFPSPGSMAGYGGEQANTSSGSGQFVYGGGQGPVIYSGGGSSVGSSMDANYAYPKSLSVISSPESGYSESASGSQYSTLRTIPVTHIVTDTHGRQQLQQQQLQQLQQQQLQQQENVEYARVNKQPKNIQTINVNVPPQHYYVQSQGQMGRFQQAEDDFDYDNPVERTPMISPKLNQSYHEQQMQYQRQQHLQSSAQQDLYGPRTLNVHSLQRQNARSPYSYQQQQHQHHHQQQQQYESSHTSASRKDGYDILPEPQPLVYPSARRPMTFEQVSSSKVSVYDNVLAGLKDIDQEE